MRKTVLLHEWVTGGGLAGEPLPQGWATEGRAMRLAIADDFAKAGAIDVVVTLDERFAGERDHANGSTRFVEKGAEIEQLRSLAAEVDYIVLIAPETGGILEERAAWLTSNPSRAAWIGSSLEAIRLTADKAALASHFEREGIAAPSSRVFRVADGLPIDLDFPIVVKPIDGAGSESTFVVRRREDFQPGPDLSERMLAQPFVKGTSYSASFLVDRSGTALLIGVGRQTIETVEGKVRYEGGMMPASEDLGLGLPRRAVESVPGLFGFAGVDFIHDEATDIVTVIEINPRPTTSYVGLKHRFGSGTIARAWLTLADSKASSMRLANAFGSPVQSHPFRFRPDGSIF